MRLNLIEKAKHSNIYYPTKTLKTRGEDKINREAHIDYDDIHAYLNDWLLKNVHSSVLDEAERLPRDLIQSAYQMGFFSLIIPKAHGGLGLSKYTYFQILELLTQHDMSFAITLGAHLSLATGSICDFGSEVLKERYLPQLATTTIGCFGLTEPGAGSDVQNIKTQATKVEGGYLVSGSKCFITNAGIAGIAVIFAKTVLNNENVITAFVVEMNTVGVSVGKEEKKMGVRASSTASIFLDKVFVPDENVIGNIGDGTKIAMSIIHESRLGLAFGALGHMRVALKMCESQAANRKSFGKPIGEFELVAQTLQTIRSKIYSLESITYSTAKKLISGEALTVESAICKTYGTETVCEVINMAMQLHGGMGYMREIGLEQRYRDSRVAMIFEGTNEILRIYIGLMTFKDFRKKFFKAGKLNVTSTALLLFRNHFFANSMGHPDLADEKRKLKKLSRAVSKKTLINLLRFKKDIIHKQLISTETAEAVQRIYIAESILSRVQNSFSSSEVLLAKTSLGLLKL